MRKYYLTLIVIAVFAFGFAASDDSSSTSSSYQEQPKQKPPFLGTYELKDRAGILYHFILKEDESVEIIVNPDIDHGSKNNKFWGKWWDERSAGGEVQIQYGDIERMPGITFPNGIPTGVLSNCPQICNGYFYSDWEQLKKRREGWRLPIKKIE